MKKTTIKDVAKKLNCSLSTVSRAFNDKYDIHPDTKADSKDSGRNGLYPNPIVRHLKRFHNEREFASYLGLFLQATTAVARSHIAKRHSAGTRSSGRRMWRLPG